MLEETKREEEEEEGEKNKKKLALRDGNKNDLEESN